MSEQNPMPEKSPMLEKAQDKASDRAKTGPSFEQGLERLERIVEELEKGDLALERALDLFEEGMKLSAACRKKLEEAENRVEILLKKDGKIVAEPFSIGEEDKSS